MLIFNHLLGSTEDMSLTGYGEMIIYNGRVIKYCTFIPSIQKGIYTNFHWID